MSVVVVLVVRGNSELEARRDELVVRMIRYYIHFVTSHLRISYSVPLRR